MTVVESTTGEVLARRSLAENESIIEQGLGTFMMVGHALAEIRDARLYRAQYGDFDSYCLERWGFDRRRASALMIAAEVSEISDTQLNEAQASALAPLRDDPEALNAALGEAIAQAEADGAKLTASRIKDAVKAATGTSDDGGVSDSESSEPATPADSHPVPSSGHLEDPAGESSTTGEDEGTANDPSSPRLDQLLPDHTADIDDASFQTELQKAVGQVRKALLTFDTDEVGTRADPENWEQLDLLLKSLGEWFTAVKAARPSGLRVINGGQQ